MFNNFSFELGCIDQPLPMGPPRLSSPPCDMQSYAVARAGKTGSGSRDDNHSETVVPENIYLYIYIHTFKLGIYTVYISNFRKGDSLTIYLYQLGIDIYLI